MAGTFNAAVREVYHEIGISIDKGKPEQILATVGWFFERLSDWYSDDSVIAEKQRELYWLAIADAAFSAYVNLTGIEPDKAKHQAISLMIRKQADYGLRNILRFGEKGVIVRSYDKYERLNNLLGKKDIPNFESIADTWLDMCNYAVIAVMLIRGYFELPFDYRDLQRLREEASGEDVDNCPIIETFDCSDAKNVDQWLKMKWHRKVR